MLISSNFLFQGQREIQYSSVLIFVIVGYVIFFFNCSTRSDFLVE
jgi:hypothetical protein